MGKPFSPGASAALQEALDYSLYLQALLDSDAKGLSQDGMKKELRRLLEASRGTIRELWGYSSLAAGGSSRMLQAGSARYFSCIARSFDSGEKAVSRLMDEGVLEASDLKQLKSEFSDVLCLLDELELYKKAQDPKGFKKALKMLSGALKAGDSAKLAGIFKHYFNSAGPTLKKKLSGLSSLPDKFASFLDAAVRFDPLDPLYMSIAAASFAISWVFLSLALAYAATLLYGPFDPAAQEQVIELCMAISAVLVLSSLAVWRFYFLKKRQKKGTA